MRIVVRVLPRAKQDKVEPLDDGVYRVRVKAQPVKGQANERLRQIIARYFGVSVSAVQIVRGHTARVKVVEIKGECQKKK